MKEFDFSVYHKMVVTVLEFQQTLLRLHYQKIDEGGKFYHFINNKFNSKVLVPKKASMTDIVPQDTLHGEAYILYSKGVISSVDEIAKIIEQMRLESLSSAN